MGLIVWNVQISRPELMDVTDLLLIDPSLLYLIPMTQQYSVAAIFIFRRRDWAFSLDRRIVDQRHLLFSIMSKCGIKVSSNHLDVNENRQSIIAHSGSRETPAEGGREISRGARLQRQERGAEKGRDGADKLTSRPY